MEYKGRFLVNVNSKIVHDTWNKTPRCKLNIMQQKNALFYDTLKEALEYPNKITPRTVKCKFCFKDNL